MQFFPEKYTCDDISASRYVLHELKEADIVPVHKKKSKLSKENYRPISFLPYISKIYEGYLYDQMSEFVETYGLQIDALRIVCDYLSNRNQRVKLNVSKTGFLRNALVDFAKHMYHK